MSGKEELEALLKSPAGKRSSFLWAFDYLIGDYFLEICQRLRENEEIGGEILLRKLRKLQTSPTGPKL
jgi:hypothetical protein